MQKSKTEDFPKTQKHSLGRIDPLEPRFSIISSILRSNNCCINGFAVALAKRIARQSLPVACPFFGMKTMEPLGSVILSF